MYADIGIITKRYSIVIIQCTFIPKHPLKIQMMSNSSNKTKLSIKSINVTINYKIFGNKMKMSKN